MNLLVSCTECYRRKKRCDRKEPCSGCARRYPPVDCIYTQTRSRSGTPSGYEEYVALPRRTNLSELALRRAHQSSPLVVVESSNVNRSQLVALNEDFLSIDSMFDLNKSLHNDETLYHCLYQLTNTSETLDVALQALCLVQLSIRNKDERLKIESMLMNGKALKMLHRALRSPSTAYATETVAASMCLKTYEELACSSENASGINQLTKGTRILVKQRGPRSYAPTIDHVIFTRWFREYDVYHAIALEVPTFLATQEWCTMPWTDIRKNESDYLIDIIAAYANVRGQVKYFEDAGFSFKDLNHAEKILQSVVNHREQLSKWLENFEKTTLGPNFFAVPWMEDAESRDIFSFRLKFQNLKTAMMYLKVWATLILIHGSAMRIGTYFARAETIAGIQGNFASKLRPGFNMRKMKDCAMNVCRSLDYTLNHTMKSSGPIYLTYPILVVHLFFQAWAPDQPPCRWSENKLREIQSSGYEFVSRYDTHNIRKEDERKDASEANPFLSSR